MRGYSLLNLPSSCCIRFVRNHEIDDSIDEILNEIRAGGLTFVYVDYMRLPENSKSVVDSISEILELPNGPHSEGRLWSFLDDLITCSFNLDGLVIVIDSAYQYLEQDSRNFFDLIEAFLVQFHHWVEKSKPCYLCFQMEQNSELTNVFLAAVQRTTAGKRTE